MRIRRSADTCCPAPAPTPTPTPAAAATASSSSYSSNSFSSTQSLTSSSNSSCLSPARCEGLDLLVKAVYYVAGSAVAVPYIQRRVIRRRKRAVRFSNLIVTGILNVGVGGEGQNEENSEEEDTISINQKRKQRQKRRHMVLPSKYHDSVLHEWKPPRS